MQSLRARWPVMGAAPTSRARMAAAPAAPAPGLLPPATQQRRCRRTPLSSPRLSRAASGDNDDTAATTATTTTTSTAALSTADFDEAAAPPPGCSRYTVNIKKPLGLVLEQDVKTLVLRVAELSPEGAAQRAGVGIGDQLIAVSGVTYGRTEEYGEVVVQKQQQRVRLSARGETLKTIGAAIASHPGNWEVSLEFQRCGPGGVSDS